MGSSGSKVAKSAAGAAQRKYPIRTSAPTSTRQSSPPAPSTGPASAFQQRQAGSRNTARVRVQDIKDDPAPNKPLDAERVAAQPPPGPGRQASSARDQGIDLDGRDPQLAAHLRTLGPVRPNPTYSLSSTSSPSSAVTEPSASSTHDYPSDAPSTIPSPRNNPALAILAARQRVQDEHERDKVESGKKGWKGRRYVDVGTLRKALVLRDEKGMKAAEIERALDLREGFVAGLGRQGVVEAT